MASRQIPLAGSEAWGSESPPPVLLEQRAGCDEVDRDLHLKARHDADRSRSAREHSVGEVELIFEPTLLENPVPPESLEGRGKDFLPELFGNSVRPSLPNEV